MVAATEDVRDALRPDQRARAVALHEARSALAARALASSGAVNAIDLVNVASWIETGRDPWAGAVKEVSPA